LDLKWNERVFIGEKKRRKKKQIKTRKISSKMVKSEKQIIAKLG